MILVRKKKLHIFVLIFIIGGTNAQVSVTNLQSIFLYSFFDYSEHYVQKTRNLRDSVLLALTYPCLCSPPFMRAPIKGQHFFAFPLQIFQYLHLI